MKRFLITLCLSVVCVNFGFASDFSLDENPKLSSLKRRATYCFEQGKREQERLVRIEILNLQQNFENLCLAVHLCMVDEKFETAQRLLRDSRFYVAPPEVKVLRDYLQDQKVKYEQRVCHHPRQSLRASLLRILSIFKNS